MGTLKSSYKVGIRTLFLKIQKLELVTNLELFCQEYREYPLNCVKSLNTNLEYVRVKTLLKALHHGDAKHAILMFVNSAYKLLNAFNNLLKEKVC